MPGLVLRGLASRKLRSALTAIAILLGVTMISGTLVLTDQIDRAFVQIFQAGNAKIDVVVKQKPPFENVQTSVYLNADVVDEVRQVDGVATAQPFIQSEGYLIANGEAMNSTGGAPSFVFSNLPQDLNPYTPIAGRLPETSGEVAVAEEIATKGNVKVGSQQQLATQDGIKDVTVVGILQYGDGDTSLGGSTTVLAPLIDVQQWWALEGKASYIYVKAADGVSQDALKNRIRSALPQQDLIVQTGREDADEQAGILNDLIGKIIRYALLAFAGVAILVGAFIIYNTFSITVAQRTREFAMLRTIGASRRQILGSVIGEAFIIGLIASAAGILLGLALAWGLGKLFGAIGFGLPATGLILSWQTVIVCLAVGIGITVLASIFPALRATKIAPIAALREGATLPVGRFAKFSPVIAVIIGVLGGAGMAYGLISSGSTTGRLTTLAGGAILIFLAVAMLSRYIVRPVVSVLGKPIGWVAGGVGRIASENAARNPARTAVTAAALMIGIGLVVFVTIFVGGIKESFTGAIDSSLKSELTVSARGFGGTIPAAVLPAVQAVNGVETASPVGGTAIQVGTGAYALIGIDPATLPAVYEFDWDNGANDLLTTLGTDRALVEDTIASDLGLAVGDTVDVLSISGAKATFTVAGTYTDPTILNGIVVNQPALEPLLQSNATGLNTLFVRTAAGADVEAVQADVERALEKFPTAQVQSNQQQKDEAASGVNTILVIFYALLALSVVISLFGIVNTLVLSIFERTREIGMLRAVGTTRRQLRAMIRWEAVITSIIGGVLGVLLGILFGWAVCKGLESDGLVFVFPTVQIAIFLVLSIVAGVLAAILPARRAAKLDVLAALSYE
jgi:putative ABC transport system permease protein